MALSVPKNSDINLYNKELAELLRKAVEDTRTHRSIILTLLNRGANTNYKPKNKKFTTFEHIIFHGDERDLVTAFLTAGARNNSIMCYTKGGEHPYGETHSRGMTLFHAAVISRNFKNIDALLWGGADINSVDENGDTALHYCKHGLVDRESLEREVYDFLVSKGADTNAMNNDRLTPQGRADQILQGRPIVDEGHIGFQ